MTVSWSFSYNNFVKSMVKLLRSHNMTYIQNHFIKRGLVKRLKGTYHRKGHTTHTLHNATKYANHQWFISLPDTKSYYILNETSKPPLDIFSYILTYMIHTWLQFTLNMENSIKQNLSKFHFHKLKLTCSIDRLYKGTIAFHFHTNAKI